MLDLFHNILLRKSMFVMMFVTKNLLPCAKTGLAMTNYRS